MTTEREREYQRERAKRKHPVRAHSVCRLTRKQLNRETDPTLELDHWRPARREQCIDGPRPCPYVGCIWHLYLDVNLRTGSIKLNFPDLEPDQLQESCVLDVADRGAETLEKVAQLMNLTRERVRQIENEACKKLERSIDHHELIDS